MPAPLQNCETCPLRDYREFAKNGSPVRACPYYIQEVLAPAYAASAASEYNEQDPRLVYTDIKEFDLRTGTIQTLALFSFLRGYVIGQGLNTRINACRKSFGNDSYYNNDEPIEPRRYLTEHAPTHEANIRDGVHAILKDLDKK